MPKPAVAMTAREVQTLKAPGTYGDGNGPYLQVSAGGAKSWMFRYVSPSGEAKGKRRDMGLGPIKLLGLADARRKALELTDQVRNGIDPLEARKAQAVAQALEAAKAITFRQCAEAYIASMKPGWRNSKHGAQWGSTLAAYVYPVIGDLPVAEVDIGLVLKVLEPIWATKTETASRVRGRVEAILDYARVRG